MPCLEVKRDARDTYSGVARTNIRDVKRAVSCKIIYYGPLPYDFITDIFFALIELAIDGVDNSQQKAAVGSEGKRLPLRVS